MRKISSICIFIFIPFLPGCFSSDCGFFQFQLPVIVLCARRSSSKSITQFTFKPSMSHWPRHYEEIVANTSQAQIDRPHAAAAMVQ
jgi:hypothetical protein